MNTDCGKVRTYVYIYIYIYIKDSLLSKSISSEIVLKKWIFSYDTLTFLCFHRPYVILEIGVAVLVIVFLFYFLITRGNAPKDFLFFGNQRKYVHFSTYLRCISKYTMEF